MPSAAGCSPTTRAWPSMRSAVPPASSRPATRACTATTRRTTERCSTPSPPCPTPSAARRSSVRLALADPSGTIRSNPTGACRGRITRAPAGRNGFGYDPALPDSRISPDLRRAQPARQAPAQPPLARLRPAAAAARPAHRAGVLGSKRIRHDRLTVVPIVAFRSAKHAVVARSPDLATPAACGRRTIPDAMN